MNKTNESWYFSAIAGKSKSSASVNGRSKFLLPLALMVVLFSKNFLVSAQSGSPDTPTTVIRENAIKHTGYFNKLFNDSLNNKLVVTYHGGVVQSVDNKDMPQGTTVLFKDKSTGDLYPAPADLANAKHVTMYEGSLFYKQDLSIYKFDLASQKSQKLLTANDVIIGFENGPENQILVVAKNGGPGNLQNGVTTISRLAVYDYVTGNVTNITDDANIYQAFFVGKKIFYAESGYWFNESGPRFRINVYDTETGVTYRESKFNMIGLSYRTSDSTFVYFCEPLGGGSNGMFEVNVNHDLHDGVLDSKKILSGTGFIAPSIADQGGLADPASPIIQFYGNQKVSGKWYEKNLQSGFLNTRPENEIWSMDLSNFTEKYVGKFVIPITGLSLSSGYLIDGRFIAISSGSSVGSGSFYTTKAYKKASNGVKNTSLAGVSVYPNPAVNGLTTVNVPANADIEVYSVDGRMTFSQKDSFGNTQIPVNSGVNTVKITIGSSVQTFKVIGR